MDHNFKINKEDYLVYQLFLASHNKRIKRQRLLGWIIIPVLVLILGLLFANQNPSKAINLSIVALVYTAIYPFYSRWRYKRHYRKHLEYTFKGKDENWACTLTFGANDIIIKDQYAESVIKKSSVQQIVELKSHFFLRLENTQSLILPKNGFENLDLLIKEIEQLEKDIQIDRIRQLDWRWR